jgi:HI0933-like protein
VRRKRVVVLGCGPAGLFAAHAAKERGAEVVIISKKRRSEMYGAQYLQSHIPGLTDGDKGFTVEYRLEGQLDDYLSKVYGADVPDRKAIKADALTGFDEAWDIRRAYYRAFDIYQPIIQNARIDCYSIGAILAEYRPQFLISTVPAPDICLGTETGHAFDVRRIWAIGDAPERGVFAPRYSAEPNLILYNSEDSPAWYRASLIAGYASVEWPEGSRPPLDDVVEVLKPFATTCDCWTRNRRTRLLRLGRYGAWNRKVMSHQAYWETLKVV